MTHTQIEALRKLHVTFESMLAIAADSTDHAHASESHTAIVLVLDLFNSVHAACDTIKNELDEAMKAEQERQDAAVAQELQDQELSDAAIAQKLQDTEQVVVQRHHVPRDVPSASAVLCDVSSVRKMHQAPVVSQAQDTSEPILWVGQIEALRKLHVTFESMLAIAADSTDHAHNSESRKALALALDLFNSVHSACAIIKNDLEDVMKADQEMRDDA